MITDACIHCSSLDGNIGICQIGSCKKKKNIVALVATIIASIVVSIIIVGIVMAIRRSLRKNGGILIISYDVFIKFMLYIILKYILVTFPEFNNYMSPHKRIYFIKNEIKT